MINFRCSYCGGEMSVNKSGDLLCSYCGSKYAFKDKDLREYKDFRYKMLYYLSTMANKTATSAQTELLWGSARTETYSAEDGMEINVNYLYCSEKDGVKVYTARNNVIFVFSEKQADYAERFVAAVNRLAYPSADVRNLAQYFPMVTGRFSLKDGGSMLILSKSEAVFPLGAFGVLPPVHAAWVMSRLENFCCVLEYSGLVHGGIDLESVFINASTHEAYLLGNWWKAETMNEYNKITDLRDIRRETKRLMGGLISAAPTQFVTFVNEMPNRSAYDDFTDWDRVIQKGFGGRRFEHLDLTDLNL